MADEPDKIALFSPSGACVTCVTAICIESAPIEISDTGDAALGAFDDFPNFAHYSHCGDSFVVDDNGGEFLESLCRKVTVPADFDPYDGTRSSIDPWPDVMIGKCARVTKLMDGLRQLEDLPALLPTGWLNTMQQTVLNRIIVGRMQGEVDELFAEIREFREGRTEIEHINELPCSTCEGKGGELLPCDECGECAVIDEDEEEDA